MLGVIVNFATVVVGGTVGTLIKGGLKEKYSVLINQGLALCVILIGVMGALKTENTLLMIISVVIGAVIGTLIGIEEAVDRLGTAAQKRLKKGGFADGFVSATLLFSVGSMAVVGSLNAGMGDSGTLLAKSALDGVSSVIIAANFGIGTAFAAVPMTIYQGLIALLSGLIKPYLSDAALIEMNAIGSLLILGIGLNMLKMTKIKVANLLPAMFVPCVYYPLAGFLGLL